MADLIDHETLHVNGALNGRTLRIINDPHSIEAINGGAGCVAEIEMPGLGVREMIGPTSEQYRRFRRLVACWNYLAGIPTEWIEAATTDAGPTPLLSNGFGDVDQEQIRWLVGKG